MLSQFVKNKRGQTVVFIILVFQVLFILFAMSLNVAMVVYDKINLQNSLDLAAYYGAKKQTEVLNAMAHINYQMRQNWKLLAWRYRILGTLAQPEGEHTSERGKLYWCPQDKNEEASCESNHNNHCRKSADLFRVAGIYPNYCDHQYYTCISQDLWRRGINADDQNFCKLAEIQITPINALPLTAAFLPEAHKGKAATNLLQNRISASCPMEGLLNWLMTQVFLTHFRLDQKDRKIMMEEIYNRTLKEGKDLDGNDIFEGAKKVFFGNLTNTNSKNVENLADYSLIEFQSFQQKEFKDLFERLDVRPTLLFADVFGEFRGTATNCTVKKRVHFEVSDGSVKISFQEFIKDRIRQGQTHLIVQILRNKPDLFDVNQQFYSDEDPFAILSLSFFKKKDEILYYGLKSEFDYMDHQIFSLNLSSGIQFKASAFAKAFGASFGPQPNQSDPFIPTQRKDTALQFVVNASDPTLMLYVHQPNFSRWPGDSWGLVDKRLHDPNNNNRWVFLNKHISYDYDFIHRVYSIQDYLHLTVFESLAGDPLARIENHDFRTFSRLMELMAVYPDLYDVSYYSILGNYHETYFPKICNLLTGSDCDPNGLNPFSSPASKGRKAYIRGDFGWPDSDKYIELNGAKKNVWISIAPYFLHRGPGSSADLDPAGVNIPATDGSNKVKPNLVGVNPLSISRSSPPALTGGRLFYPWLANPLPGRLLSSWFNPHPLNYKNYEFNSSVLDKYFLQCEWPALARMPVPGACVGIGRTGYSVKLISCEAVRAFLTQPDAIDEFCPS